MAADIKAGRAYVQLYVKNREFLRGLRNARERVKQFASDLKATGQVLATLGGASLLGIGLVGKKFADFDDQMRAVKAVTQATQDEFERLTNKAKALGAATSYTAVEVAGLMAELGRAGFKPDQIEEMTGAVLDLARATGTDAAQSAGIMAATIRQFGLVASDATRVADGLTAAANGSFNTVEMLGEALSYAGPVASDFNMNLEETLAILGALGNVGIQASSAGTALRRLLTLNGAEADKLKDIFGVTFRDAAGNARPLIDVLDEVNKATANLGTADRAKKFNEAFGLLGITGASAIGKSAQGARDLLKAIESAGGQANRTAKEMDSGLGGSLRMMWSAVEGVGIAIGDALAKPLAGLADIIQSVAGSAIEWIKANQETIVALAGIAAGVTAVGAAMVAFGSAVLASSAAVTLLSSATAAANAILTVLRNPVTIVTAGLTAAAAVAYRAAGGFEALSKQAGVVGVVFRTIGSALSWFQANVVRTISETVGGMTNAIIAGDWALAGRIVVAGLRSTLLNGVATVARQFSGILGDTIGKIGTQILSGDFSGAWTTALAGMYAKFQPFIEAVLTGMELVSMGWQFVTSSIATVWQETTKLVGKAWQAVIGYIPKHFEIAVGFMSGTWGDFTRDMVFSFGLAAKAVTDLWGSAVKSIGQSLISASAEGGLLGGVASSILGVDLSKEKPEDVLKVFDNFNSSIDKQVESATTQIANAVTRGQARSRAKAPDFAFAGGREGAQDAADAASLELFELRQQARRAREYAFAEAERQKQEGRNGIAGAANGMAGGLGSRVTGTFSAAAFAAMGQGQSAQERTAKAAEKTEQALRMLITKNTNENQQLLQELQLGGRFV